MGALRKLQRVRVKKQRKETQVQFNQMVKTLEKMKKVCAVCEAEFDNKNPEHLDKWRVQVYEDRAELYCEKCYTSASTQEKANG